MSVKFHRNGSSFVASFDCTQHIQEFTKGFTFSNVVTAVGFWSEYVLVLGKKFSPFVPAYAGGSTKSRCLTIQLSRWERNIEGYIQPERRPVIVLVATVLNYYHIVRNLGDLNGNENL